jgi:hypothetical protein
LICELDKAWLVSQAQASHGLGSVQGNLFDFVAAPESVLALSVFDLHPVARPNHNPNSFSARIARVSSHEPDQKKRDGGACGTSQERGWILFTRDQAREQCKGNQTTALASHGLGRPLLAHIKHTLNQHLMHICSLNEGNQSTWPYMCWPGQPEPQGRIQPIASGSTDPDNFS